MARPAETWLHDSGPGPAFVDIVRVRHDDPRVLLPAPAQKYVSWLDTEERQEIVLELAEPGRVVGYSWEDFRQRTTKFVEEQLDAYLRREGDGDARKALIAMGERFLRARITKDKYVIFSHRVIAHLALSAGANSEAARKDHDLYFVAVLDTIEFWTRAFRERARMKLTESIADFASHLIGD